MSPVTSNQWLKVAKTAAYVALSALVSYAITLTTDQPELFGAYAGLVNVALVALKQLFTEGK